MEDREEIQTADYQIDCDRSQQQAEYFRNCLDTPLPHQADDFVARYKHRPRYQDIQCERQQDNICRELCIEEDECRDCRRAG